LVDEDGAMVGIVPFEQALARARKAELDLCEISPTAKPPVCRIMDYGKHLYQQKKKEHEAERKRQTQEQKQLRLRSFRIDKHDLEIKVKQTRQFIENGDQVLFTLQFRARENDRPEMGRDVLLGIAKAVADVAQISSKPNKEGKRMTMLLTPVPNIAAVVAKLRAERERLAKEKGITLEPEILPEDDSNAPDDDEDDNDADSNVKTE
jgi:translation initiation factor IF-3